MKKILNIFAGISLITAGASSVVACGSGTKTNTNDQNIVNDIINRVIDTTFAVNEDKQGDLNFGSYSQQVLKEVRKPLANDEQDLVSFAKSENPTLINAEKPTNIKLHIQSHKIYQDINIPVKLNYDAQSISNAINAKTVTVLQTGGYQKSESANKYKTSIESQINKLLTPVEQQSGYQISNLTQVLKNTKISWPSWKGSKKIGNEVDPNKPISLNIQIGQDKASANITLEFQYYEQKKVLDDPNTGGPGDGLLIDSMSSTDWDRGLAINEINQAWGSLGGMVGSLESDVVYKQVLNPGEKTQPIKKGQKVECEMYFTGDNNLSYTQDNPRIFWVEGN